MSSFFYLQITEVVCPWFAFLPGLITDAVCSLCHAHVFDHLIYSRRVSVMCSRRESTERSTGPT